MLCTCLTVMAVHSGTPAPVRTYLVVFIAGIWRHVCVLRIAGRFGTTLGCYCWLATEQHYLCNSVKFACQVSFLALSRSPYHGHRAPQTEPIKLYLYDNILTIPFHSISSEGYFAKVATGYQVSVPLFRTVLVSRGDAKMKNMFVLETASCWATHEPYPSEMRTPHARWNGAPLTRWDFWRQEW